jgi:hypothetical protein
MMPMQAYHGGCQCGAVRFEADLDLDQTATCNCSRCQKLGSVFSFTARNRFSLVCGADNLTEYLFHKRESRHFFCKTCGIQGFAYGVAADGTSMAGVNANCLDGIDPRALKSHHYDGRGN